MQSLRRMAMRHQAAACMMVAALGACLSAGCRDANPLAPTNAPSGHLTVRPQLSGLTVGDVEPLTLTQVTAKGEVTRSDAVWAVDRPDIVSVDSTGRARAVSLGTASVTASVAGQQVVTTLRVVPNVAGLWRGELQVDTDTRTNGDGPYRPAVGQKAPLEFNLVQTHDLVTGNAVVLAPLPTGAVGAITADWDTVSTLRLHGTFTTDEGFEVELADWASQVDSAARTMSGRFAMTQRFTNIFGPQTIVKQCTIVALIRTAF
jgi:hypothetical protein